MGFEIVDENLLNVIQHLVDYLSGHYSSLITAGQMLGGVMSVLLIGGEIFKIMLKQNEIDILSISRPLAISFVLASWIPFVDALGAIPRTLESYSYSIFQEEHAEIMALREARTEAAEEIKERVQKARAAAEMAENQISDGSTFDKLMEMGSDMLDVIQDQLYSFGTLVQAQFNQVIEEWVMKIGEFFWQVQVYLLFFIKEVFAGILIITGPLTFGLSVLPVWKDAWSQWISRYVSVLFFGFVGFFVMAAALQIVKYGIYMDTMILTTANSTQEAFAAYSKSSMVTALYHFVTLIVGGCALKMVPELSTWIILANAGQAAKEFVSGAYSTMKSSTTKTINMATNSKK